MKEKSFVEIKFYDRWTGTEGYIHREFSSNSDAWEFAAAVEQLGLGEAFLIPESMVEARKASLLKNQQQQQQP